MTAPFSRPSAYAAPYVYPYANKRPVKQAPVFDNASYNEKINQIPGMQQQGGGAGVSTMPGQLGRTFNPMAGFSPSVAAPLPKSMALTPMTASGDAGAVNSNGLLDNWSGDNRTNDFEVLSSYGAPTATSNTNTPFTGMSGTHLFDGTDVDPNTGGYLGSLSNWFKTAMGTKDNPGAGALALGVGQGLLQAGLGLGQYNLAKKSFAESNNRYRQDLAAQKAAYNNELGSRAAANAGITGRASEEQVAAARAAAIKDRGLA